MTDSIGIIGLGTVGGALRVAFERAGYPLALFDTAKQIGSAAEVDSAETVFICVPTPYVEGVGCDTSAVEAAVRALTGSKVVVVKSTVIPGTTERLQASFPQHRFLMNPEFLREVSAVEDMLNPDRQIVGYTAASQGEAERVLKLLPRAPFERVLPATAVELIKYMGNAFLAAKVMLANEVFDLCAELGVDYESVVAAVAQDGRIGPSHLKIQESERGYGGKCLPKDVAALVHLMQQLKLKSSMLEGVLEHNRRYRNQIT